MMLLEQAPYEIVTVSTLLHRPSEQLLNPNVPIGAAHEHLIQRSNGTGNKIDMNLTLDIGSLHYNQTNNTSKLKSKKKRRKQYSHCETLNFVVYGIMAGSLCLLGMSGNTLSILVLQKDKSNEVACFLLQALAVADNLVLIMSFIILSLIYGIIPYTSGSQAVRPVYPYIVKFVHPLGYMAQTLTIWMTVLLAINRFIAVCRPFHATTLCTARKARCQLIAVVAFSILFNLPRFFQFQIVTKTREEDGRKESYTSYKVTAIGERSTFGIIYTNAIYSLAVLLLPLVLLVYFNIHLVIELRNMRRRRNSMSTTPAPSDQNITLVMVIIVVIFLICHTPDRILQGIKSFWKPEEKGCYNAFQNYTALTNILIIINSSTNFLVYYLLRKRFRRILIMCLFCKERQSRKHRLSSLSTNGLQQITLMSSTGAFERDTVTHIRNSSTTHRLSHNAIDSCTNLHRLSNVGLRKKVPVTNLHMNRHRNSH